MSISYKQCRYKSKKTNAIKNYNNNLLGRNLDGKLKEFLDQTCHLQQKHGQFQLEGVKQE